MGSFLVAEAVIVPVIVLDAVFLAKTKRTEEGWFGLPVKPSIARTSDGRTWLTLGGQF